MTDLPLIAVVNDDSTFLDLMHDLLSEAGYRAVIHKESDSAYELVKAEQPALVVLDIRMDHQESGWQVLELLRLDPATAAIPVIVCSADAVALRAKAARLAELGCVPLEKPFDLDELLRLVEAALGPPAA